MPYQIYYHPLIPKDLKSIPQKEQKRIQSAIQQKIAIDPTYFGQFLKGSLKPSFKFRVGDYRIIYDVQDKEIIILMISHRKEVYKQAGKRKKK